MNKFEKNFRDILLKALEYEETKSITTAVEVTKELAEFAHDIITVAEILGGRSILDKGIK